MIKTDFDIAIDLNSIMYSESTGIVKTLTPGKGPSGFIFDLDSKSDISPESLKRIWGCPGCHLNMDNRPLPLQGCTAPYEMALAPDPQDKTSSQQIVKRVSVVHKEHPYTEIVVGNCGMTVFPGPVTLLEKHQRGDLFFASKRALSSAG